MLLLHSKASNAENQGILAERKSIYSDIDTLRSLGYDIQLQRGRGGGYWMASRAFELSELKLLVDAVQSSSVISARTSKRIIHKLEALCSDYEGIQLQRQVYVDGRPKTDSQTLLYSIDALHTAINLFIGSVFKIILVPQGKENKDKERKFFV